MKEQRDHERIDRDEVSEGKRGDHNDKKRKQKGHRHFLHGAEACEGVRQSVELHHGAGADNGFYDGIER